MFRKIFFVILGFLTITAVSAQQYKQVQVSLRDGQTLKGKNGAMFSENVSFTSGGLQKTYALYDVDYIQAKQGKALKWAIGMGGGCLGLCVLSGVIVGSAGIEEMGGTVGQYIAGTVIWTGLFAGLGALIGHLTDPWRMVYSKGSSSIWNNFDLYLGSNQYAKVNLTLSYKLPNQTR